MPFLTAPSEIYKNTFLQGLKEFQAEGKHMEYTIPQLQENFGPFVKMLLARGNAATTLPGRVPESIFWLIDGNDFIGRVSIRHTLTEDLTYVGGHIGYEIRPTKRQQGYGKIILQRGLEEAKFLGLKRVLLTCDANNIASQKIIEANGGVLEDETYVKHYHGTIRRYWIQIS